MKSLRLQKETEVKAALIIWTYWNFWKLKKRIKLLSAIHKLLNSIGSQDAYIESNIYLNFSSIWEFAFAKHIKIIEQRFVLGFDSNNEIFGRINTPDKILDDSKYKFMNRFKNNILPEWIGNIS